MLQGEEERGKLRCPEKGKWFVGRECCGARAAGGKCSPRGGGKARGVGAVKRGLPFAGKSGKMAGTFKSRIHFEQMNWEKLYHSMLAKHGYDEKPQGFYTERHRIVPGCLGGKYEAGNVSYVPPRVHFLAHVMLARIHANHKLWLAALRMKTFKDGSKSNSRLYSIARRKHAEQISGDGAIMRGRKFSEETLEKIGARTRGKPQDPEHSRKISIATKGKKKSAEHVARVKATKALNPYVESKEAYEKRKAAMKGIKKSPEHIAKMKAKVWTPEEIARRVATRKANNLLKKQNLSGEYRGVC